MRATRLDPRWVEYVLNDYAARTGNASYGPGGPNGKVRRANNSIKKRRKAGK